MRNQLIDVIRFLAAIAVALFHFNCYVSPKVPNWYSELVKYGWLAVPSFFVISGYCIALAAEKSKNFLDFGIKRFFRIYPPYIISWIFTLIIIMGVKYFRGYNRLHTPHSILELFYNLTLLTYPFSKIEPMNPVYWSLTVEVFFYIVIAALKGIYSKNMLFSSFAISIVALMPIKFSNILFFMNDWAPFAIGFALYYLINSTIRYKWVASLMILINFAILFISNHFSYFRIFYLSITLGTVLLIYFGSIWKKDLSRISWLGDFSFGIYIIHFPLGVTLFGIIKNTTIFNNWFLAMGFDLVSLFLIISVANLFYRHVESPFMKLGKMFTSAK